MMSIGVRAATAAWIFGKTWANGARSNSTSISGWVFWYSLTIAVQAAWLTGLWTPTKVSLIWPGLAAAAGAVVAAAGAVVAAGAAGSVAAAGALVAAGADAEVAAGAVVAAGAGAVVAAAAGLGASVGLAGAAVGLAAGEHAITTNPIVRTPLASAESFQVLTIRFSPR